MAKHKKMKITNNGSNGGNLVGNSHQKGGIKALNKSTGDIVELEGGEVIINKDAVKLHHEKLSEINQSAGNGVPILDPEKIKYNKGGNIKNKSNKFIEFTIPFDYAYALINADTSGLSDEDEIDLNNFVDEIVEKYGNAFFMVGSEESFEPRFEVTNDVNNLGADVVTLYLQPSKEYNKGGNMKKTYNKKNNIMAIAKEIRKPNEKWQDAIKRASKYNKDFTDLLDKMPKNYSKGGGVGEWASYEGTLFNMQNIKWHSTKEEAESRVKGLKGERGIISKEQYDLQNKYSNGGNLKEKLEKRIPIQKRIHEKEKEDLLKNKRKTINQYFVQGNYGSGWEDLTAHDTISEAKLEKIVYDENETQYPHRIMKKRIKKENYITGNFSKGGNIIEKMLKENTGKHFLDSGGDSGRMWQRNQEKDFEQEPRVWLDFDDDGIAEPYPTVSTYHYLNEVLDTDSISDELNDYLEDLRKNDVDAHWVQECVENIVDAVQNGEFDEDSELYFAKIEPAFKNFDEVVNTYNYENNLSQVLLYSVIKINDEPYTILQIHNGADVRGGYTDAKVFKLNGYLTGNVDVYGGLNGKSIDNMHNGYSLTYEDGEEVEQIKQTDDYSLDFMILEDMYLYKKGGNMKTKNKKMTTKKPNIKERIADAYKGKTDEEIIADARIQAKPRGKRVTTKKGKTSNQYGTFKNKVGRTYTENRINRSDISKKLKLETGGNISKGNSFFDMFDF